MLTPTTPKWVRAGRTDATGKYTVLPVTPREISRVSPLEYIYSLSLTGDTLSPYKLSPEGGNIYLKVKITGSNGSGENNLH